MKKIDIRKILVPIDFSRNSIKALRLAVSIAKDHAAAIQLLHVTDNDYELFPEEIKIAPTHFTETTQRLGTFARSVIDEHALKCFYTCEYGAITHCVLKTAVNMHADMIILGKNGSNSRVPAYAGTHCCQIAEKSPVPVMIVPEEIEKYSCEKVLFPVRALLSVPDKYDAIRNLLVTNPAFTLLNLRDPENESELHVIHHLDQLMKARLENDSLLYTMEYYFRDNKFAEKVISKIRNQAYDLAIITSEADEVKSDFQLSPYARQIIHNTTIPLLLLHANSPRMSADEILNKLHKAEI